MDSLSEQSNSVLFVAIMSTLSVAMVTFPINAYRLTALLAISQRVGAILPIGVGFIMVVALHLGMKEASGHFASLLDTASLGGSMPTFYPELGLLPVLLGLGVFVVDLLIERKDSTR